MRDRLEYLWLRSYPAVVGVGVGILVWLRGWGQRPFHDEIQGDMFGGVLGLAALLASILLGLLGVLSALEHRQVVKEMRRNEQLYGQLVSMCLEGIGVFLCLSIIAIVGLLLHREEAGAQKVIGGLTLALCAMGLAETLRFALQLVRVLVDREPPPEKSPEQNLTESRSRLPPIGSGAAGSPA